MKAGCFYTNNSMLSLNCLQYDRTKMKTLTWGSFDLDWDKVLCFGWNNWSLSFLFRFEWLCSFMILRNAHAMWCHADSDPNCAYWQSANEKLSKSITSNKNRVVGFRRVSGASFKRSSSSHFGTIDLKNN